MSKTKIQILFLIVICVISVLIMGTALIYTGKPNFTPPPFEVNAISGLPEVPDENAWGQLDATAFQVGLCGKIRADTDSVECWFYNPDTNQAWLKLRILDGAGEILGETGLLHPGEYMKSVRISRELPPGERLTLKIMAYEPDTYYSLGSVMVNTSIVGRFE